MHFDRDNVFTDIGEITKYINIYLIT